MNFINVIPDGDGCWQDLADDPARIVHLGNGSRVEMAALAGGMTSGQPSVAIRIDLPDGRVILLETTLRLLESAVAIFRAKHGAGGVV